MEANGIPMRVRFFPNVWKAAARIGIDAAEVIRRGRLPAAMLTENMTITLEQSCAFWGAIRELSGNPAVGLEIARGIDLAGAPPILLAPYHARDWRDAIERIARYKQMCAPERLHIREEGEVSTLELEWVRPHAEAAIVTDVLFAALMDMGRRGTGEPLEALRVELARPKGDVAAHQAYFGGEVRFGADASRLVVRSADLRRRFASYNAELLEMLSPALERALADHEAQHSIADQVKWHMKRSLATTRPDMRSIARELALSERTLQRRLAAEGTRFQDVLTLARRELAHEYLANGQLDMGDIAFLLGFDDQNSFFRAFRQWEGETPARWRNARTGAAPRSVGRTQASPAPVQ